MKQGQTIAAFALADGELVIEPGAHVDILPHKESYRDKIRVQAVRISGTPLVVFMPITNLKVLQN